MTRGVDPAEFDALERQMWAGIWTAADAGVADEHGVELRCFGPVQTTTIADLPEASSINLVLGATAPGAVEEGHLDRNPCLGINIKVPELDQKVLTASEVAIFLKEARISNHRFYPIWTMALMTGMRSGELYALRWTDVDLYARKISVTRQWTSKNGFGPTKTRLNRVVPISEELVKFLKELKLQRGNDEYVLPHANGWHKGEQARITREFCHAVGVTEVKFHDLRATFITNLLSRGESLARVMSIVGHNDLKTTNGYLRKAGVDVQGATDKLGYSVPEIPNGELISFPKGG